MNDQRGDVERDDGDVVVVALSRSDAASTLVQALTSSGFDAIAVEGIGAVADAMDEDQTSVVIVDDAGPRWLRDVSDLLVRRPSARPLASVEIESSAEFLAAVSAGVTGFVSPLADGAAIARTVQAVIDDGVAIPRGLVPALVDDVRRGRGHSVATAGGQIDVTDREWEILQLLLQRRSTREISELLFVSVGTVRSHISALGKKLGAADRDETIRLLERGGG